MEYLSQRKLTLKKYHEANIKKRSQIWIMEKDVYMKDHLSYVHNQSIYEN